MCVFDGQGILKILLCKDDDLLEFQDAMGTLVAFSFVNAVADGKSFEMNRLVQLSTRRWLMLRGEIQKWRERALHALSDNFPDGKFEDWDACEALLPHAHMVLGYDPHGMSKRTNPQRATLLYRTASCF
jgi:hypothetical protein